MRRESGVMQEGDDWPGVFIRGDDARCFALMLQRTLEHGSVGAFDRSQLRELLRLMESCEVRS